MAHQTNRFNKQARRIAFKALSAFRQKVGKATLENRMWMFITLLGGNNALWFHSIRMIFYADHHYDKRAELQNIDKGSDST